MVFDVHSSLIELLVLCSTLLILNTSLRQNWRGDLLADEGGFWHEKDDADTEDAEENGAHAESPLVAKVLDDIAGHETSAYEKVLDIVLEEEL